MQLTEAEIEEGRRLLNNSQHVTQDLDSSLDACVSANQAIQDWLWEHADALLASPEEIAREAVREFAMQIGANVFESSGVDANATIIVLRLIKKLAAARGVTLGDER